MGSVNVRSEASICLDDQLTGEQRQAGDQAYNLMLTMLASKDKVDTPQPSFLPRLDKSRSNRVILLDGGRGSGKTWLLVNILDRLRSAYLGDSTQLAKANPKPLWENSDTRIVPIGLLDLHPLPPSTNLLFHVIGRFERVVEWLEGDGKCEREPVAWHLTASGELESRKKWRNLLRAVAAGWDGNVKERSARLDLDAYTVELEETERQRLHVVEAFVAFVDALATDFSKRQRLSGQPLFVIGVDDADMSMDRSVELLDTVRMLWHPRVAFILTGDSRLFLKTLDVHCLGQVRKPLLGHTLHAQEIRAVAPHARVRGLANDIYDKIVPPGHRCELRPIPPTHRLDVPVSVANSEGDESRHLKALFAKMHAEPRRWRQSPTLDKYFDIEPQLCDALPERIRGLTDLATLATLQIDDKSTKMQTRHVLHNPASQVVHAIWKQVLHSSDLYPEKLDDAVRVSDLHGAVDVHISGELSLGFDTNTSDVVYSSSEANPRVTILQVDRFDSFLERGQFLPRPVTAALMLASTIGFDQAQSFLNTPSSAYTGYERRFASSVYASPTMGSNIAFSWPLPPGYTLPFYAAFSYRWKAELRQMHLIPGKPAEITADMVDELGQRFLRTTVELLLTKSTNQVVAVSLDWKELARGVVELTKQGGTRSRQWAECRAGLFAAPEYGLSARAANDWLALLHDALPRNRRDSFFDLLRSERRKALKNRYDEYQSNLIMLEIDDAHKDYHWRKLVEERSEKTETATAGGTRGSLPISPIRRRRSSKPE